MPRPKSYLLTASLLAAHVGASVFCLAASGEGRTYRLYAERPGAEINQRAHKLAGGGVEWCAGPPSCEEQRADLPSGAAHVVAPVAAEPALIRIDISGPLLQRAGYQDPCGGWTDGHDAVAERLCAAFALGDVLLVVDGPGGAAAGIQQAVGRALAAKVANGRRCTGYVDEQCASAHAWWMLALCDEVFTPPLGQVGSVGARGGHMSHAGQLAQEGLVMTYFADPPNKVALAPEFPLSEVGALRGNRDVKIMADAFRAAVCASPIGVRYGLTPESLIALGADMLTGEATVGIFTDGVETLEAVTEYALALAEGGEAATAATDTGAARAAEEKAMSLRTEGDEKPKMDEEESKPEGTKPDGVCANCGTGNPVAHKFCAQCGDSMEARPLAEEEDEPPPSSKPKPKAQTPAASVVAAPPKMSADASLASVLRASAESPLAVKTAAIGMRQVFDTVIGITGKTSPSEMVGALLTMPERLAQADVAAKDERDRAKVASGRERADLAARLNKLNLAGWSRGQIYRDETKDGKRVAVDYQPVIKSMDLGVLRGLVEGFEKSAPKADPFQPSRDKAKADAAARASTEGVTPAGNVVTLPADGKPTKEQIAEACKSPTVLGMFHRPGNKHAIEQIAEQYVITAAANHATIGAV